MKKVLLMAMLFGAITFAFVSCGSGEAEPAEGGDTTAHVEGDGHSH